MRPSTIFVASLLALTLVAQGGKDHGPKPSPTAARAGSQIPWIQEVAAPATPNRPRRGGGALVADLAKAVEAAGKAKRPVLWYVTTLPGSPMDRKPELDRYMMYGLFSSPDVVSLVSRRTIPTRGMPSAEDAKRLGLKAGDVIEPAILLLKPDGSLAFKLDRITTHHAGWLTALLDRELKKLGELGRPSDATNAAADPHDKAMGHLLDGDVNAAMALARSISLDPRGALVMAMAARRLGSLDVATNALAKAPKSPESLIEAARLGLAKENWGDAADASDAAVASTDGKGPIAEEALLLKGMALYRGNKHTEARRVWSDLAARAPNSPFAWKAAAEAESHGPFVRGFEEVGALPADALLAQPLGTGRPRQESDVPWLTKRSITYLLEMQEENGSFIDSQYDFGGRDSLPDVYMACTAICAMAILEWRDQSGVTEDGAAAAAYRTRCDDALLRAWNYLADESHSSTENTQERMWNHSYRILFFSRWLELGAPDAGKVKTKLQEVVKLSETQQKKGGIWAHEYPNPFVSATVLHAMHQAKQTGVNVNQAALAAGEDAVAKTRDDQGRFAYGTGKGDRNETFAAGRMPACELALLLGGKATQQTLTAAIETAFKHQAAYESVRKYDDHAPPHRIGGFFFFWDMLSRGYAINAVANKETRTALNKSQRAILLALPEVDGRFIDSHELGKPYGTAMALVIMKLCGGVQP